MTLDGLQAMLETRFQRIDLYGPRRTYYPKVHLIRYADDFIVTAQRRDMLEQEVMPMIKEFLQTRGLTLSEEKTKITHIEDGFDFLGFNIRKYKGKLLIMPSKESQKRFQQKVNEIVNSHKTIPQESFIRLLNPGHNRVGELLPTRRVRQDFPEDGLPHLSETFAMVAPATSGERKMVGSRKVFPQTPGQDMGFCRTFRQGGQNGTVSDQVADGY